MAHHNAVARTGSQSQAVTVMASLRVALVSREVFPLGGGGIGEYIAACARLLSTWSEVTIFTTSSHRDRYEQLCNTLDVPPLPETVQIVFVPEAHPSEQGEFFSTSHLYSARVFDALRDHYGALGPDLAEFSDYLGEGAVTGQARRAGMRFMRNTTVTVRLHTTAEICAILDGHISDEWPVRVLCELERRALLDCDYLVWPGGDTLAFYRRFYGRQNVGPGYLIRNPPLMSERHGIESVCMSDGATALRLLYLGRLERRKGIHTLIRAMSFLNSDEIFLDVLGGDTDTAPLGGSMAHHMRLTAANDPRIRFLNPVPREELAGLIRASDAVILPSLWEAWPYVGLEALRLNRPIIATPVGGFTEMVQHQRSGWLARDTSATSLAEVLRSRAVDRASHRDMMACGNPSTVFEELTDPVGINDAYKHLIAAGGRWRTSGASQPARPARPRAVQMPHNADRVVRCTTRLGGLHPPLVSVIIPYYRMAQYIADTVHSAFAQTYARVEVVVVNDGSDLEEDWILPELATTYPFRVVTQINGGLGAARNFGISQSHGRFIVPLDADDMLEPTFVASTLAAFELDPTVAFVTSWTRYVDERGSDFSQHGFGYQPLGNQGAAVLRNNVASSATALIPRWIFDSGFRYCEDLTSYEDWHFYQDLHQARRYGVVIPERLLRYRVRPKSMIRSTGLPNTARLAGELRSHRNEKEIEWLRRSG